MTENLTRKREAGEFYFLSNDEVRFFTALSNLIVPEGEDRVAEPGAITVGGLNYIDSVLLEFPKSVQDYFRNAISILNDAAGKGFSGKKFADASSGEQDALLRKMFLDPKSREMMFDLRSLVLEAFYSDYHDPWYDGPTGWVYTEFSGKRISDVKKDWSFLKIWRDWLEKQQDEA